MQDFLNKVAFITGGASGIGLGMAKEFLAAGMRVVITDVRREALNAAANALADAAANVHAIVLDVTDRARWVQAVEEAESVFGNIHILCNNAGVNISGPAWEATYSDWDFCLGINIGGVVNGIHTVVPRMIGHGEGGHVVNTSSSGGLFVGSGGVYCTSKYAVIGLSEALRRDLATKHIGVSVLCPSGVQSELFESTIEVRPKALADSRSAPHPAADLASRALTPIFATAMTPEEVGRRVLAGIRRNDMYIMTHPEIRPVLEARARALLAALPDEPVNQARVDATAASQDSSLYDEQIAKPPPKW